MYSDISSASRQPVSQGKNAKDIGASCFSGKGTMPRAMREQDWDRTLLGSAQAWPESIRTAIRICLNSDFPLIVLCGKELVYIYNDAAIPIFGDKHPWALGQRAADVWPEAWNTFGPMLQSVLATGVATRHDDLLLVLQRRGYPEECYFTFSYSAIMSPEGTVDGVFVAVLETSERVINERRLRTLSDLATQVASTHDQANAFDRIRESLSRNPFDLPLAALYLTDGAGKGAEPVLCTGLTGAGGTLQSVLLEQCSANGNEHPIARAAQSGEPEPFKIQAVFGDVSGCGQWPEKPIDGLVLPFRLPGQKSPRGFLVVGINPRKGLDPEYQTFFDLVASHLATAVANAEAIEAERRRAAAIAELDRSKSAFISNAGHELRTPVTLILGPLEEFLAREGEALSQPARESLETARRNARRLHTLVNSLMDYARIDAGQMLAKPEPTDIGQLTSEITSLFRSAIESAGIRFSVRCGDSSEGVLIDRNMWETVVQNLLSNAFKFTLKGRISVDLHSDRDAVCLSVSDTGTGIAPEDMPHIFERFFRGKPADARSAEGSGVGLALVHELVHLHGGRIDVDSVPGRGTRFVVRLPRQRAGHKENMLPQPPAVARQRLAGTAAPAMARAAGDRAAAERAAPERMPVSSIGYMRVLVVDDNEDMVRYIRRLLSDTCEMMTAHDGASALEMVRTHQPDLVLTDVMMPSLDGLDLLRAIRADTDIHTTSVIVLSARAGEEARLEALKAGADDYLVKPFSAHELIVRVESHVQLKRVRREAAAREGELQRQIDGVRNDLERVLEGTNAAYASFDRELRILALNKTCAKIFGGRKQDLIGRLCNDAIPEIMNKHLGQALRRAVECGVEAAAEYFHSESGQWFNMRCYPALHGAIAFGDDISERKEAEGVLRLAHAQLERGVAARTQALQEAGKLLAAVFDHAPGGIALTSIKGDFIRANAAYQRLVGYTEQELLSQSMRSVANPEDFVAKKAMLAQLLRGECDSFQMELRYIRSDGRTIWVNNHLSIIDDEEGQPRYFVKIVQDITDRKRAEQEILASQTELRKLYERLQAVREEERVALAREVHDQLGQVLSAAKIDIKLLEDAVRPKDAPLSRRKIVAELRSASRTLDNAIKLVRGIATELRAPELEGQGLYAAVEWHARDFERRTRIKCTVAFSPDMQEPKGPVAMTLFRIFQEAMTNVLRHAKARNVWIGIAPRGGWVLLRVRDDGTGIPTRSIRDKQAIGLKGMRERAALANGRLVVGSLPAGGTLVAARLPLIGNEEIAPGATERRPA